MTSALQDSSDVPSKSPVEGLQACGGQLVPPELGLAREGTSGRTAPRRSVCWPGAGVTVRLSITSDQWPEKLVPHVPGHRGCSVLSRGPWMGSRTPPEAALLVFPPDIERNPLRPTCRGEGSSPELLVRLPQAVNDRGSGRFQAIELSTRTGNRQIAVRMDPGRLRPGRWAAWRGEGGPPGPCAQRRGSGPCEARARQGGGLGVSGRRSLTPRVV